MFFDYNKKPCLLFFQVNGCGSYAEWTVVPEDRTVALPHGLGYDQACVAMAQGLTAHYLVHDSFPVKKGDTVLVHAAAGGTGQLVCQMAKLRGDIQYCVLFMRVQFP